MNYKMINDKEALLSEIAGNPSNIQFIFNGDAEEIIEIMHKNGYFLDRSSRVPDDNTLFKFIKAEPKTLRDNYFCPGCGACVNICPNDALKWKGDEYGYYRPLLDADKCINCGKCTTSCPVINPIKNENTLTPECYEFIASDDEILKKSSSGGVFSLLAMEILKTGGLVCGVAWREDFSVEHILIDKEEDLYKLQKSKYMQSDVGFVYREIKKHLEDGKNVLFSGSPCHVTGLKTYLGNEYGNLYTVDILCSHAPSAEFFKKYINDTFGENKIQSYEFRHKVPSWNRDCDRHKVQFIDGTTKIRNYSVDPFQHVFHKKIMSSDACNWCRFSNIPRPADITLGDFWGIENFDLENAEYFKKGVSAVLINGYKGKELFQQIMNAASIVKKLPLEWLGSNGGLYVKRKGKKDEYRDMFYDLYKKLPFPKAADAASMMQFDIGLVGFWNAPNYGGLLTYYALNRLLLKMGYSVLMIKNCIINSEEDCMSSFIKEHYIFAKYNYFPNMDQYNNLCKIFITGSDQIWNYRLPGAREDFFLDFVNSKKKKIAYGTSFGKEEHEPSDYDQIRRSFLLQRFDSISVREDYAVDIAKNVYNVEAEHVLDPVFLVDKEEYLELIKDATFNYEKDFIGAYILDPTLKKCNRLLELSKILNLDIIVIQGIGETLYENKERKEERNNLFNGMILLEEYSPQNFLYIFNNSKFIITDSFHGVCFSYIFQKDFLVFYNVGRGLERFYSLMKILKLEERRIYENDIITKEKIISINYSIISKEFELKKERSINWLRNAISKKKENKPNSYDYFKSDFVKSNNDINSIKYQLSLLQNAFENLFYKNIMNKKEKFNNIININNICEYLNFIKDIKKHCLVIIAVRDTTGRYLDSIINSYLNKIGFNHNLQNLKWRSYIGIIESGSLIYENLGNNNENSFWTGKIKKLSVEVNSKIFKNGNEATIIINGLNYAVNGRGLNIVIFDMKEYCYIDSVSFDTCLPGIPCFRGTIDNWIGRFILRLNKYKNRGIIRNNLFIIKLKRINNNLKKLINYKKNHTLKKTIDKIFIELRGKDK